MTTTHRKGTAMHSRLTHRRRKPNSSRWTVDRAELARRRPPL
ncbi:hypothetical protein ACFCWY_08555 [Streptomyces sp. NPDC056362]